MTAAERNFCLAEVEIARVDKMDIDGLTGAVKLVEGQGYAPLSAEEMGVDDETTLGIILNGGTQIYRLADSKLEGAEARLGIKDTWLKKDVQFSAIPSPALKDKIRDEFGKKFKSAARQEIKQRIQEVPADKKLINLSPASLVDPALGSIEQNLEYNDRRREQEWLSSLVAHALIDELRRYPEARTIAERLVVLQGLAEDQSTLTHDPDAKINFGLSAAAMQFILPKDWFNRK
jgi:hypothetical protein